MRRALLVLALLAPAGALAEAPCRPPRSYVYPADLGPALDELEDRGVGADGPRDVLGCVEAFFRPLPSEAAALFMPWLGIDNIHVPFSMRGEETPGCSRPSPFCPHRIELGEHAGSRSVQAGVILHELAHAEYDVLARSRRHRAESPRLARLYQDIRTLRQQLKDRPGFDKWPWMQAQEMGAYYIETSVSEVLQRVEAVFLSNRFNVNRVIQSRADREALRVDGREVLIASPDSPTLGRLWSTDPAHVGGRRGDAFFEGEPIDAEIPVPMRERLWESTLGLELPRSGDEVVALARSLDTPWARNQRRLIAHARDRRVERLEREADGGDPAFTGLATPALVAPDGALSEEERALLRDFQEGAAPVLADRSHRHRTMPPLGLAHYERPPEP